MHTITSPSMSAMDSWIQKAFVASAFLGCMVLLMVKAQQFTVQPESVVQAEGLEAVFECLYSGAVGYTWFISGSGASLFASPPGIEVIEGPGGGVSVIIPATSEYNTSVVLCEAQVGFGSQSMFFQSKNATLGVYGVEVTQSSTNVIILYWTDQFTTNLTYCVEINQTVLGSTETVLLDPVCGLTGTQYTFSHPDHTVCDRFSFTVTPTEGGRRGTSSQSVTGFFTQAKGEGGTTTVSRGEDEAMKQVTFNGMIPDCTTYSSFQVDSDLLSEPISGSVPDLQPITFSLPTDKVTEVIVTLTDINEIGLVFENIPTSTSVQTVVCQTESPFMKIVTFEASVPNGTHFTTYQLDSVLTITNITFEQSSDDTVSIAFIIPTDKVTVVTVTLSDVQGVNFVRFEYLISTYDVQDLIIYEHSGGGGINVSVVFAGGSQSPGALVCVMPILTDGSLDFNNMTLTTIPRDMSESVDITVPTGTYRLFEFDLESNGLPRMPISVAADSETVNVTVGGEAPLLVDVGVTAFILPSRRISVTCSDVTLKCLVLVWSTTDNPDQVHVSLIDSDDDRTVVLSLGATDVSVVVYTWKRGGFVFSGELSFISQLEPLTTNVPTNTTTSTELRPPTDPLTTFDPGVIAGIAVIAGVLLLLVTVTGVVVLLLVMFRRKHPNKQGGVSVSDVRVDWSKTFPGIEQPSEAYSVVLNKNIAYEQTQRAQRQRDSGSHNPTPSEGNGGEYEDIEPVHQYEEVLPQDRACRTNYVNIDTDNII